MMSPEVARAYKLAKSGEKVQAQKLLISIVKQDAENENAWLLLAMLIESQSKKILCLQKVLEINPTNEKAERMLSPLTSNSLIEKAEQRSQIPLPQSDSSKVKKNISVLTTQDSSTDKIVNPQSGKRISFKFAISVLGGLTLFLICGIFSASIIFQISRNQGSDLGTTTTEIDTDAGDRNVRIINRYDDGVIEHLNNLTDLINETNDLIVNTSGDLSQHSRTILRIGTDIGVSILEYRRLEVPPSRTELDIIINNYNAKVTAANDALLDYSYSNSTERYEALAKAREEQSQYWKDIVVPFLKGIESE